MKLDNESVLRESGKHDLDSSVSSSMSALSPSASSPHPFSDTDSTGTTGTTENSDALKTSTPSLGAYYVAKENKLQNDMLFEEPATYQNDTSHSTEGKADDEDDDIPYSMI